MDGAGDWGTIESDPGIFTLLIRKFGAFGVQFEEIWSLEGQMFEQLRPIHGLIFLFKYIQHEEPSGTVVPYDKVKHVYFAKQVINNACATQAIISLLMNVDDDDVILGRELSALKEFSMSFDPRMRGLALSNSQVVRAAHNSMVQQSLIELDHSMPHKEEDAYHFVGYLPIAGRLYELDGLREGPIDHGPVAPGQDWIEVVRPIILRRMNVYTEGEIHFNLMAMVADRRIVYERQMDEMMESLQLIQMPPADIHNEEPVAGTSAAPVPPPRRAQAHVSAVVSAPSPAFYMPPPIATPAPKVPRHASTTTTASRPSTSKQTKQPMEAEPSPCPLRLGSSSGPGFYVPMTTFPETRTSSMPAAMTSRNAYQSMRYNTRPPKRTPMPPHTQIPNLHNLTHYNPYSTGASSTSTSTTGAHGGVPFSAFDSMDPEPEPVASTSRAPYGTASTARHAAHSSPSYTLTADMECTLADLDSIYRDQVSAAPPPPPPAADQDQPMEEDIPQPAEILTTSLFDFGDIKEHMTEELTCNFLDNLDDDLDDADLSPGHLVIDHKIPTPPPEDTDNDDL